MDFIDCRISADFVIYSSALEILLSLTNVFLAPLESKSKLEIKRDYDYLFKLWQEIKDKTLKIFFAENTISLPIPCFGS